MEASPVGLRAAWGRLTSRRYARGVLMVVGGTAAGQVLALAALPLITRLYTTSDFGVLAVYTSMLLVLMSVASLRYELTLSIAPDGQTAANLLALCLLLVVAVAAISGTVALVFADQIAAATNTPALADYMVLLPLGVLAAGAYQALSNWAIRARAFGLLARTKLSQSIGLVGVQIAGGALIAGPIGLLLGLVCGQASGTASLARSAWRGEGGALRSVTRAGIRAAAARYRHFPLYSTPSGLLNSLGTYLPAILLAALFDDTVAGLFALSQRVIAAPMLLVGRSVSQVYMGEAAELIKQRDFPALWRVYVRTARMSALVGAVPVALLAIGGPLLFGTIFGEQWAEAGAYVQVMSLMLVAQFVAAPVAQTLNLFERVGLQAVYDGVRLVLGNGALVAAWALGWDALAAVAAYSAAMFVSYCVNIVLNSSTIRRASASTLPGR